MSLVSEMKDVLLVSMSIFGRLIGPTSTSGLRPFSKDVFTAGTDTSASTVEWVMSELMRNPEVLKGAQSEVRQMFKGKTIIQDIDFQELKYLKMVVKETFRLHPPVPLLMPRECRESCEINGYVIPIKTKVIVNAWALGRDPEYWHDPESFLPERFENTNIDFSGNNLEYLQFGAGRRMCPGSLFGLANVEITLSHLLYHFDWKISGGINPRDLDMSDTFGVVCRKKNHLYLIATPYTPL
ncbi:premnaspirodiene oxygenase-like [Rutidosis leptorrhynchoides]|uniref:premnaspirodiene oxygenase-like n=1 Tax=Rutidosis leptorrhynchoides TaxID=125765 RepID=UPI003A9A19DE